MATTEETTAMGGSLKAAVSVGAVILATIALRLTGLMDDFWLTLGKVGFPVFLYWAWNSTSEEHPKFAKAIAFFAVGWTTIFILVPVFLNLATLDLPFTREASKVSREDKDFRVGEWLYPSGHEGLVIYRNLCQHQEVQETAKAKSAFPNNPEKLWHRLEEIRVERQKCADRVVGEYHPSKLWAGLKDAFVAKTIGGGTKTNIVNGLLFVGLLFGVGIGVCALADSGRSRFGEVLTIMGIIGTIYLVGSWLISLDTSSIKIVVPGDMSARTIFWILAGLVHASILGHGVVRKRSPVWKMIFLLIVMLIFDWLWWQHGVSTAVLKHLATVKWV